MGNNDSGWSKLWTQEDWLAVWIGFLVILCVLLIASKGIKITGPSFKWSTEAEFTTFCSEAGPTVEKLAAKAGAKGDAGLQAAAVGLKAALDKSDRKAVSDAAKKLESTLKETKDKELQKNASGVLKAVKGAAGSTLSKVFSSANIINSLIFLVAALVLSLIAMALMGENAGMFVAGFPIVFLIAWAGQFIAGSYTVNVYGIEYVLWCLAIGLFISNVIGLPEWLKPAVKTEFYIKTGLVILGSGVLFKEILQAGYLGILQAFAVVGVVWYSCYWIARKLKVDEEFAAILSSAVSICGVSAAIATSGAIKGDPKKLSYTTSLVLICAVPMMILQPYIAKWVGMPDAVAGAWLGGTLDTSGSVVAAGSLISETAMKVGVIVKMGQNVLIGFAAFILAVVWTFKAAEQVPGGEKPGAIEIWNRFPKFVLGFMIASLVFSFLLSPAVVSEVKGSLGGIRTIWFALAFTCIGLETNFAELTRMEGGRPAAAFLIAQGFNVIWTLLLAYLLFGGILFETPVF
ncbi:MAG: putative sulfate exporter family transporter [Pseudomonadota bacterium]